MTDRRLKHWGWGYEDQQPSHEEVVAASEGIVPMLGFGEAPARAVELDQVELRAPRLDSPGGIFTDSVFDFLWRPCPLHAVHGSATTLPLP